MKKIAQAIKLAYKAIGLPLSEEDLHKLDEAESEDAFVPYFDRLTNEIPGFGTRQKEAGRAEIYQGMDAKLGEKLEGFRGILGEEKYNRIKATPGVAKLGMLADDFAEAYQQVQQAYQQAQKDHKSAESKQQQQAQEQVRELTRQIEALTGEREQAVADKEKEVTDRYEKLLLDEALLSKIRGVRDLAREYNNEEIIRGVLLPRVNRLAGEKQVQFQRTEGGYELLREDGSPYIENNARLTVDDLVTLATRDYAKRSDGGEAGLISVDGNGSTLQLSLADQWQSDAGLL